MEYSKDWNTSLDIPKILVGKLSKKDGRDDRERENNKRNQWFSNEAVKHLLKTKKMGNVDEIKEWFRAIKSNGLV